MKLDLKVLIIFAVIAACDDDDQSGWMEKKVDTATDRSSAVDTNYNDPDSGLGDIDPQSNCTNGESGCWNENLMHCVSGVWLQKQNCSVDGGWCWMRDGTHFCLVDTLPDSALYDTSTAEAYVDTASLFTTDSADTDSIHRSDSERYIFDNVDFNYLCNDYCERLDTCDLITDVGLPIVTGALTCQVDCVGEMTRLKDDAAMSDCNEAILETTFCAIALPCPEMRRYIDGIESTSEIPCGSWYQNYLDTCH